MMRYQYGYDCIDAIGTIHFGIVFQLLIRQSSCRFRLSERIVLTRHHLIDLHFSESIHGERYGGGSVKCVVETIATSSMEVFDIRLCFELVFFFYYLFFSGFLLSRFGFYLGPSVKCFCLVGLHWAACCVSLQLMFLIGHWEYNI